MEAKNITLKLPAEMIARLDSLATLLGSSRNALVKQGVSELLNRRGNSARKALADLCGCVEAPADAGSSDAYKERFK